MSRWFRFYSDALNDPKVQSLPDALFKQWVNILCHAAKNDGDLGSVKEVAFALRINESKAAIVVTELATRILLDRIPGGYFKPHNWSERQYESDSSTKRVQAYRERKRQQQDNASGNVSETTSETAPETEQNRSEQNQGGALAPRVDVEGAFVRFWAAYPRRDGANPREPARRKFAAAVKGGIDPEAIILAARRYGDELRARGQMGTQYVAQAVTWLNQQRWGDHATTGGGSDDPPEGHFVEVGTEQWLAWCAHAKSKGRVGCSEIDFRVGGALRRGWYFPSEWPPGFTKDEAA
jgi:hypothetical protein